MDVLSPEQPPNFLLPSLAAISLIALGVWLGWRAREAGEPSDAIAVMLYGWPLMVLATVAATGLARWTRLLGLLAAVASIPFVAWMAAIDGLAGGGLEAGPLTVLAHLAVCSGCLVFVACLARTRLAPETITLRRRLGAARRYLARELARPAPRLRDEWIPHVVALGLGGRVDRWLRIHGAGTSGGARVPGTAASGTSRWSGSGGRFSGGGASGSWGALGSLAAVSAASRSSGGGSGSSGGSSSGGGGGGGW